MQIAPRHAGTLNALFADGHVESQAETSIDPRITALQSAVHNEKWLPVRDLAF